MRWRKTKDFNRSEIYVGDSFLVRVDIFSDGKVVHGKDFTPMYYVITATEDGWECNGESWGWDWSDIECLIPCKEFDNFPFDDEDSSFPPCEKNAKELPQ